MLFLQLKKNSLVTKVQKKIQIKGNSTLPMEENK